jgi:hypothetical protein
VVLAGEALLGGVSQHLADQAAERLLGKDVVADVIGGHC